MRITFFAFGFIALGAVLGLAMGLLALVGLIPAGTAFAIAVTAGIIGGLGLAVTARPCGG